MYLLLRRAGELLRCPAKRTIPSELLQPVSPSSHSCHPREMLRNDELTAPTTNDLIHDDFSNHLGLHKSALSFLKLIFEAFDNICADPRWMHDSVQDTRGAVHVLDLLTETWKGC